MDDAVIRLARQLLDGGFTRLSDREQRVITHIAKRQHISRDVNAVHEENQTFGDRLADKVARFGGSWTFIVIFTSMLLAWVILNTVILARYAGAFDPYPYIFLNLILSMVAALQAPATLDEGSHDHLHTIRRRTRRRRYGEDTAIRAARFQARQRVV